MTDLAQEIARRSARASELARRYNFATYTLLALAVSASAVASISVAAGQLTPVTNAILTAVPAIVVLVNSTFRFDERARYYFERRVNLDALGLRLGHESEDVIAKELSAFIVTDQGKYPPFGALPGSGSPKM